MPLDVNNFDSSDCFEKFLEIFHPYVIEGVDDSSKIHANFSESRKLKSSEYTCDVEERVVTLQLMPSTAVKIYDEVNYLGHDQEVRFVREMNGFSPLFIEPLTIKNSQGSIIYKGDQATKAFRAIDRTLYVLEYD